MKIEKFYINNFRSLINFKVDNLATTTIFYGLNNAGKSNILKALEFIFQRKVQSEKGDFTNPINFYEGVIKGFSNNFFNNDKKLIIDFSVDIIISKDETVIKNTITSLFKKWPNNLKFSIDGIITNSKYGDDFAEIQTKCIKVNDVIIYEFNSQSIKYFPTLQEKVGKNPSDFSDAFSHFINPLNDCVYIISSVRQTHATDFDNELLLDFSPSDLKKSLYSLYLTEKTHSIFEEINSVFNKEPFSFGNISFANINGELELMIKNDNVRLPIKHLGSGVEQILSIITSLICKKSKIICIEELEQNLSPRLQNLALRKIQTMIGKSLDQLILSSHSSVFNNEKLSDAIFLIEKEKGKTVIGEKRNKKIGAKMKKHFIDTAFPNDTYTDEELEENYNLVAKITEDLFKR